MADREYRVLLAATFSKEVRVLAPSAKVARQVIYEHPRVTQLGGLPFSENVGAEFVIDVVRADEDWHADRKSNDSGVQS